jgi:hypothetical protein
MVYEMVEVLVRVVRPRHSAASYRFCGKGSLQGVQWNWTFRGILAWRDFLRAHPTKSAPHG